MFPFLGMRFPASAWPDLAKAKERFVSAAEAVIRDQREPPTLLLSRQLQDQWDELAAAERALKLALDTTKEMLQSAGYPEETLRQQLEVEAAAAALEEVSSAMPAR